MIKDFIFTFFRSLNPDAYKHIVHRRTIHAIIYFFSLVLFLVIMSALIHLFTSPNLGASIDSKFSKIERLNVSLDIKLKEPITVLSHPFVVIDLTGNRTAIQKEDVLITEKTLFVKKLKPDILHGKLHTVEEKDITQFSDIPANKDFFKRIATILFILLIPSILFIMFLYYSVKYLLAIVITVVIALAIYKFMLRRPAHLEQIANTALYASTAMVFLGILISPFFGVGPLPEIVFIILFIVGLMMTSEKEFKLKKKVFEPQKKEDMLDDN